MGPRGTNAVEAECVDYCCERCSLPRTLSFCSCASVSRRSNSHLTSSFNASVDQALDLFRVISGWAAQRFFFLNVMQLAEISGILAIGMNNASWPVPANT